MAPHVGHRRTGREARARQGSGRLPGSPRVHRPARWGDDVNPRIERLRESLEEPLLVTNPVNIHYLFGFKSSNAALLVEPDRARLFTDFRYSELRARWKASSSRRRSARCSRIWPSGCRGRSASRPTSSRTPATRRSARERSSSSRGGPRRGLRAVKDEDELDAIRAGREITDRGVRAACRGARSSAAPSATSRGPSGQLFREAGAEAVAFETIVASGPNAARRTAARPTADRTWRDRRDRHGLRRRRLLLRLHAHVHDRLVDGRAQAGLRVVLAAQQAGLDALRAGRRGVDADAAARDVSTTRRSSPERSGTVSGTASASRSTRRRGSRRVDRHARGRQRRHRRARHLPGRTRGIRIEDNS